MLSQVPQIVQAKFSDAPNAWLSTVKSSKVSFAELTGPAFRMKQNATACHESLKRFQECCLLVVVVQSPGGGRQGLYGFRHARLEDECMIAWVMDNLAELPTSPLDTQNISDG